MRRARAFGAEPSRRVPGVVVALVIVAALAALTAGRQLLGTERPPAPPPATTVPAPAPVTVPVPVVELQPVSVSAPATPSPLRAP
jgi:hypothetical protein